MLRQNSGATEREIKVIELLLGVDLPETFKEWLKLHNGGWPDTKTCWIEREFIPGSATSLEVSNFLSINEIIENRAQYGSRVPSDLIPIANDYIGNLICLGIVGFPRNCIYLWDHENEAAAYKLLGQKIPPNHTNLHLVADSFEAFLDLLGPIN